MRQLALALLLAAVVIVGLRWGTFAVGGSDSYCYVHQAERWASLRLQLPEPLALEAPWPDAALAFAPAGHVPSQTVPGAIVPICPSGLSIAMAPLLALGGPRAIFLVVPIFGALFIWSTFTAGARFGPRVGLAAAVIAACSPAFLYQLVQPMSDVPAAALWMLAVASVTGTKPRAPIVAGLASGAAILMRPNLVPLAIPIGLFLLLRPERSWGDRLRGAAGYAAAAAPGAIAVALIQQAFTALLCGRDTGRSPRCSRSIMSCPMRFGIFPGCHRHTPSRGRLPWPRSFCCRARWRRSSSRCFW